MELTITARASLALDECLVATLTLAAGPDGGRCSARLNLVEGDVALDVRDPAGAVARCHWPWPVDAMPRWIDLAPGQHLVGTVPLVATDTSAPLFPLPGPYRITAAFDAAPGHVITSAPLTVARTSPADGARARALRDRDVLQSLLSASALAGSVDGLAALLGATTVTTQALASLALDRIDEVVRAITGDDARDELIRAVAAVLPPSYAGDPRRATVERLAVSAEARALLAGTPI